MSDSNFFASQWKNRYFARLAMGERELALSGKLALFQRADCSLDGISETIRYFDPRCLERSER